ncbi:hypothetical protein [Oleiharenicola sp. Vm1]|uniref:hypothetical protein n=1 Tax=Oleiharenicola sp. Vm1 TaxID=3398393 RepID=UPI0039F56AA1
MILPAILALVALALIAERAEQRSRRYYHDQFFLRASGFFTGAALVLFIVFLAQ